MVVTLHIANNQVSSSFPTIFFLFCLLRFHFGFDSYFFDGSWRWQHLQVCFGELSKTVGFTIIAILPFFLMRVIVQPCFVSSQQGSAKEEVWELTLCPFPTLPMLSHAAPGKCQSWFSSHTCVVVSPLCLRHALVTPSSFNQDFWVCFVFSEMVGSLHAFPSIS